MDFIASTNFELFSCPQFSEDVTDALGNRLRFRKEFLCAVRMADSQALFDWICQNDQAAPSKETEENPMVQQWKELLVCLDNVKSSTSLGNAGPSAFSVKLQRKLATTVPPRPIVQIGKEAAFDHLEQLCRHGSGAVEVLNLEDSHHIMVSPSYPIPKPR
jgi:hypothetical protein